MTQPEEPDDFEQMLALVARYNPASGESPQHVRDSGRMAPDDAITYDQVVARMIAASPQRGPDTRKRPFRLLAEGMAREAFTMDARTGEVTPGDRGTVDDLQVLDADAVIINPKWYPEIAAEQADPDDA